MNTLLRITGIGKLISFYRYIYFDGPRVVSGAGIVLLLLVGFTHMYAFLDHFEAAVYIGMSFAALFVGTLVSAFGILMGRKWAWALGAAISGVAFVAYIISRTWGLPGFEEGVGAWDTPAGTFAVATELLYLGLYFSIITSMNVAYPDRRDWYD